MIQLNLLPGIKQEYIKAQRTRRLITAVSTIVTLASIGLMILMLLFVDGLQKKQISSLSNDIKQRSATIKSIPDLNKILTVQNQLKSLSSLHNQKPAANRLSDYLKQTTPAQADINNLTVDFNQKLITITGTSDALSTVNKYIDTLKFTTYNIGGDKSTSKNAFSNVVLTNFGRSENRATYTITTNYDPPIFDITQDIRWVVPDTVTTRSELDKPNALFTEKDNQNLGGQ